MKKLVALMLVLLALFALTACKTQNTNNEMLDGNFVKETSWDASDGSRIIYADNGTFKFYKSKDDFSNYYYVGTFESYKSKEAVKYVTQDLNKYSVTLEELNRVFSSGGENSEDNFVSVVLNNQECIIDGVNTLKEPVLTPYYGFYVESTGKMTLVNMNSGNVHHYQKVN